MNLKGEQFVWIMCNDAGERKKLREFLTQKEIVLVVEQDGKRYFGKFASTGEKNTWRENNRPDESKKGKIDL